MGLPGPHRADIGNRQPQRSGQHRHIEFRIVSEHANHGPAVDGAGLDLGRQIAVWPIHHHFISIGESFAGGEHRAGVADGHPIAEERADPGNCGGKINGAEDQHSRRRRVAGDKNR